MKRHLLTAIGTLLIIQSAVAQTTAGIPESIRGKFGQPKTYHEMPSVKAVQEIAQDEQRRIDGLDKKFRFGLEHSVSVDVLAEASKKTLPNGDVLYQYGLYCPGAISINVIFDRFELATGSRLYLAAKNGESFVGAYTSLNNNANKILGTDLVYDQYAIIELVEPKNVAGQSMLHLGTVVHGYQNLDHFMEKALGQAGACNIDVNCPLGIGWEKQRNSVACVISGGSACSGSLVNNTSGTIIPYYLSANHCGTIPGSWVFRFRWERTAATAICAAPNSTANNGPTNMTINGGVLKASNSNADFILVELNTAPNPAWGIYYNGWDRSDALTVTQGTGIHHPYGDIKKICREDDPLTQQIISFNGDPNSHMWRISNWEQGVTQPSASGSPLFDQNHRTIGVLTGGDADCSGMVNNGKHDFYGRFGIAWDLGATPDKRLKDWLDPGNLAPTFIDGIDPAAAVLAVDAGIQDPIGVKGNICGGSVTPKITLFNAGTSSLTSVSISYGFGVNSQTYNWTGNLAQFENTVIALPEHTLTDGNHVFNASILNANGSADSGTGNNTVSSALKILLNGEMITLDLNLDRWASETSWQMLDQESNVLFSGGGYPDGNSSTTTTPITVTACLSPSCYKFKIMDSQGDGMTSNNYPSGSYTITNSDHVVLAEMKPQDANFGSVNIAPFCLFQLDNGVFVFPNPADKLINVYASDAIIKEAFLFNLAGQRLISKEVNGQAAQLDVDELSSGMYIVKLQTSDGLIIRQVIVN